MKQILWPLLLLFFSGLPKSSFTQELTLPLQPEAGPGGTHYIHDSIQITQVAHRDTGYWLFEPGHPTPDSAHIVVFLHGYGAINPMIYGGWIQHLVRKGNIVIYPRYQRKIFPPRTKRFAPNAVKGIKAALYHLDTTDHLVALTENMSLVGHSYGGALVGNLAARYQEYGLPKPTAALLCSPGSGPFRGGILKSYENIPVDMKLLVMVSERDKTVGDKLGKRIFNTATQTTDRHLIVQRQDQREGHGTRAGHNESYSLDPSLDCGLHNITSRRAAKVSRIDAVDFYAYWKLLDALHDCTRLNQNCEYAIGNTVQQQSMGTWSDGQEVLKLKVE